MNEEFLLNNDIAKEIYESIKNLPIIDYHCHLDPKEIAENKRFKTITEIWLYGDHYKWRLMRASGVDEKYITGDASDYEKFLKWASVIEECIGNPVYIFTHLELKRYFGYDGYLSSKTAEEVWEHCNAIINKENFSVKDILNKFNVETLCTTDDPIDDLVYHKQIKADKSYTTKVLPTFRPSFALNIENDTFTPYIKKLERVSSVNINNYKDIVDALHNRIEFFNEVGCRLSDHALDPLVYEDYTEKELDEIVKKKLNNEEISLIEIKKYKTALFQDLSKKYSELNWVSQMHMNCIRNTNSKGFGALGADTGFDCISDFSYGASLIKTLDELNKENKLPKTIFYSLNENDNNMLATVMACFQDGKTRGKMQLGSAWWFNDNYLGMRNQMLSLANQGILSRFIGMLTDSRSFLSYPRHEYFRRILAELLAEFVIRGDFSSDKELLAKIAKGIAYENGLEYFGF